MSTAEDRRSAVRHDAFACGIAFDRTCPECQKAFMGDLREDEIPDAVLRTWADQGDTQARTIRQLRGGPPQRQWLMANSARRP